MSDVIKTFDEFPLILKLIFALPCFDVIWVVYRLLRSLVANRTIGIVLAIVLIVFGLPFLWLIDIVTLIAVGKVIWID